VVRRVATFDGGRWCGVVAIELAVLARVC
ncbi:hypothetical protein A2U01_0104534, partial [Trifolium medium]|nr:hypothetical protein [Trifolium medium]